MAVKGAINVDALAKEIASRLAEYTDEVVENIDLSAEKIAKSAALRLRATSPILTGSYAAGWKASRIKDKWIVHNRTDYQLTHLLEKGHAKVGGGRVAPKVHIAPVEEIVIQDFLQAIEEAIKG